MATLNLRSGTPQQPAVVGNGTYNNLWGDSIHDCVVENAVIDSPPPGEKPQIFGCTNITFRNCTFRGIRASQEQSHVEGIHINGGSNIRFEQVLWEDNDVFHAFITVWGGYPPPSDIVFVRNRFGHMGPAGGYYSVKVRDEGGVPTPPCPGLAYEDCERKGPDVWPDDAPGAAEIKVLSPDDEWTPWDQEPTPPDPEPIPEPPDDDLEARITALETALAQTNAALTELTARFETVMKGINQAATADDAQLR